jgi:hypothetical protein
MVAGGAVSVMVRSELAIGKEIPQKHGGAAAPPVELH